MFEAYKIGIKLSLVDHVSAGLAAMSRSFMKTDADAKALEARILSIKKTALTGALMTGAGLSMVHSLKGPYEKAKELAQAKTNFETLNLSAAENQEAYAKAAAMSHDVLGTAITENVKHIHDLHTAFGDLHHAIEKAEKFAKFSFVAKVMNGGKPVEGLTGDAVRALEHRGPKVSAGGAEFDDELDMMQQVYLGTRGRVAPSGFLHASQTGKMAYSLMAKEELYGPFAAYMSTKSGPTAGTAAMTFASSMLGGHMDDKGKGFMTEIGLWEEGVSKKRMQAIQKLTAGMSKEEMKNMGFLTPVHGGLKSEYLELAVTHQSKFINEVLAPAIRRRFGLDISDEKIAQLAMENLNRNTAGFIGDYVMNHQKFEKDSKIFRKTATGDSAYQRYLKSPEGAEEAASNAWSSFLTMFGSVYLPAITSGMLRLASIFDTFSQVADRYPTLFKILVTGFVGLAGALAFGGAVNLLRAAFMGLQLVIGPGGALLTGTTLLPALLKGGAAALGWLGTALTGPLGIAIAAGAAAIAIGKLFFALKDFFEAVNKERVKLTPDAQRQADENKPAMDELDRDFKTKRAPGTFDPVAPARPQTSESSRPVQLVLREGGKPLADVVSKVQGRQIMRPSLGGGYDMGVHEPDSNMKVN